MASTLGGAPGALATIKNAAEQAQVQTVWTRRNSNAWLGGMRDQSAPLDQWKWIDGSDVIYQNWLLDEPNNFQRN
jgi:hypothetical protein